MHIAAVTILAFVYVPLNMATSIVGMKIQELNQSGQKVWMSVLTAVLALLVTAGGWFLVDQANTYRSFRAQKISESEKLPYTIGSRVAILSWLVWNRHGWWAWKIGAWLNVLTNSSRFSDVNGVSRHEARPVMGAETESVDS